MERSRTAGFFFTTVFVIGHFKFNMRNYYLNSAEVFFSQAENREEGTSALCCTDGRNVALKEIYDVKFDLFIDSMNIW